MKNKKKYGLYKSKFEFDSCGIGFIANIKGEKSFDIISDSITMLENMEHRGATGYESNTGDGAGIQIQIPHEFLLKEANILGFNLPSPGDYGVGVLFFPQKKSLKKECKKIFEITVDKLKLNILGYRSIPVNNSTLGSIAKRVEPIMEMVFIKKPIIDDENTFERKLFILRNYTTKQINSIVKNDPIGFYISSFSCRKLIYKGQLRSIQLREYFIDLQNKELTSAFGMVHSRFATNTNPSWGLAQPFRYIVHNGEINTIQGNLHWLRSSEKKFKSPFFTKKELDMVLPLIQQHQSDSACLDNVIEILTHSGRSLPHTMMMLMPEAWDQNQDMEDYKRYFYEFHSCIMEPWDGPAALFFTDGKIIGAILDRNGLRPSRFCLTTDGRVIMGSESGALVVNPTKIIKKGQLKPGKMFLIDMIQGKIIDDEDIKKEICTSQPYQEWIQKNKIDINKLPINQVSDIRFSKKDILKYQKIFGYTREDVDTILKHMAETGKEPIGSMGFDSPLAILSTQTQHLSSYFKQLFAQITNPPIDPIRERLVMSLTTIIGEANLLVENEYFANCIRLDNPILNNQQLEKLKTINFRLCQAITLKICFKADGKKNRLKQALNSLCKNSLNAIKNGCKILILSDRSINILKYAAIPSLLACSAVHHHLIRNGIRGKIGIIIEAGDIWEIHHFATLIGFGATAVNPYLAFESIRNLYEENEIVGSLDQLIENYIKSVKNGLLKILSKIGISTLQSYHGSQTFEIIGINEDVVKNYFTGTTSRFGGLNLDDLAKETLKKHFSIHQQTDSSFLMDGGIYQWRKEGEYHAYNPETIYLLQQSTKDKDYKIFKKYTHLVNRIVDTSSTIRGLLELKNDRPAISIDKVEPIENIMQRFSTGAMSFGSISFEAHSTLAIAMNRIQAKSNTGEGGEDEQRYELLPNGDSMRSAIKQIASGRFGVTSRYLAEADELQIKIAQGAKPGEGGQLPGSKVDEWIAKTRNSTPGVGLISPPPHHDIYSIEDLAQLIFDLKNANRHARISVKLVSKSGVGTIASGVVKAKSDHILISGYDGGTGAASLSSIRHAGLPWELGLAEIHQTLIKNKLRQRVTLQTDGQIKTGRDIVIATLLGAEEWGIATSALIVEGCILMRKCHLNTCPVGIATQNPDLRKKFHGNADHIVNYFKFLSIEVREIMAKLGFRTIQEMVGQYQCLTKKKHLTYWKYNNIDLSLLLQKVESRLPIYKSEKQDHHLENSISWKMLKLAEDAIKNEGTMQAELSIVNTDRTVGTILSHEITKKYKSKGMQDDSLTYIFRGTAGQSFGAFCTKGISMILEGDANDYFGKGLSGAKLVVFPNKKSNIIASENSIIGNVALYGATSGKAFINGIAGERFGVRNSGAIAVVEGIGDHGCEYMTGGIVIILGNTGRNFGAGMSGGVAYIWNNEEKNLVKKFNSDIVQNIEKLNEKDYEIIKFLIKEHYTYTTSNLANLILNNFEKNINTFIKVLPKEYKKAILNY